MMEFTKIFVAVDSSVRLTTKQRKCNKIYYIHIFYVRGEARQRKAWRASVMITKRLDTLIEVYECVFITLYT